LRGEDPAWDVHIPAGENLETGPDLLSQAIRIHKDCGVWMLAFNGNGEQMAVDRTLPVFGRSASWLRWYTRNFDLCRTETDETMALTYIDKHGGDKGERVNWDRMDTFLPSKQLHTPEVALGQEWLSLGRMDVNRMHCSWLHYTEQVKVLVLHPATLSGERIYMAKLCCDGATPSTVHSALAMVRKFLEEAIPCTVTFPAWRRRVAPKHEALHFLLSPFCSDPRAPNLVSAVLSPKLEVEEVEVVGDDVEEALMAMSMADLQQQGEEADVTSGCCSKVVDQERADATSASMDAVLVAPRLAGWVTPLNEGSRPDMERTERQRIRAGALELVRMVTPEHLPLRVVRRSQRRTRRGTHGIQLGEGMAAVPEHVPITVTPLKRHRNAVDRPRAFFSALGTPLADSRPSRGRRLPGRHPLHGLRLFLNEAAPEPGMVRRLFGELEAEGEKTARSEVRSGVSRIPVVAGRLTNRLANAIKRTTSTPASVGCWVDGHEMGTDGCAGRLPTSGGVTRIPVLSCGTHGLTGTRLVWIVQRAGTRERKNSGKLRETGPRRVGTRSPQQEVGGKRRSKVAVCPEAAAARVAIWMRDWRTGRLVRVGTDRGCGTKQKEEDREPGGIQTKLTQLQRTQQGTQVAKAFSPLRCAQWDDPEPPDPH
jgi:hypothetical protein